MPSRAYSLFDRVLGEIDKAIKVLSAPIQPSREAPGVIPEASGGQGDQPVLKEFERLESIRLMRVNHSGEVAAQALYRGQALAARHGAVAAAVQRAANEEMDHLAWCAQRLQELKGAPSLLNPLWYAGSFAIGAVAGALGDQASLGFITETEKQVESHLRGHLDRLAPADERSRAILEQMSRDEMQHGAQAASLGGEELPFPLKLAMHLTSKVMTAGSYWL
jgi:ubiquinone biosynthesis monooxygenase Coq7